MPVPRPDRISIGPVPCSTHTQKQFLEELKCLLSSGRTGGSRTLTYLNAHVYNLARRDPGLRSHLRASRIIAPDGVSILLTARLLGHHIPERCLVTDVFMSFLGNRGFPPTRALLFGGTPEVASAAAAAIHERSGHCRVVEAVSGYLDEAECRAVLMQRRDVDLVLFGMGSPKSERMGALAAELCPNAVAWHIGGGTVMALAGRIPEAPAWMRTNGFQWLHRLFLEPRRMWRRYLIGNLVFVASVLGIWLSRQLSAGTPRPGARRLRVGILGDRGIPAVYGGFSTLVEEVSIRLAGDHGMDPVVYCRRRYYPKRDRDHCGVRLIHLPAPGGKHFESLIHTFLSMIHASFCRYDAVLVVDPGNAPVVWPLRLLGVPILLHTDGIGWKRRKWGRLARNYYRWSERVSTWVATRLIADAEAMRDYYRSTYGAESDFIPYGSRVGDPPDPSAPGRFGLEPGGYFLVVTRIEPDNNTDLIIREYRASGVTRPLVIVGGARYPTAYSRRILESAGDGVRLIGSVYDSATLNGLYAGAFAYIHGHEVGGTNPALLRAMDAGAACIAIDVVFHREVLGDAGLHFGRGVGELAGLLRSAESEPGRLTECGERARERARRLYSWDAVAADYARLIAAAGRLGDAGSAATAEAPDGSPESGTAPAGT